MIRCIILSIYIGLLLLCILPYITFANDFKQKHYLEANKNVVEIKCKDGGSGSAVIIDSKILTAFHVIQNTQCFALHNTIEYELELIKYDIADDLALRAFLNGK